PRDKAKAGQTSVCDVVTFPAGARLALRSQQPVAVTVERPRPLVVRSALTVPLGDGVRDRRSERAGRITFPVQPVVLTWIANNLGGIHRLAATAIHGRIFLLRIHDRPAGLDRGELIAANPPG